MVSLASASASVRSHCSKLDRRSDRMQRCGKLRRSGAPARARPASASPVRSQPVGEAHHACLLAAHAAAGEDHVERVAVADQARQADRAAVDQRHTPAPAVDAEHGILGGDPQIAHHGQLEPACDGVSLDGGDHRLAEHHSRRAHRPVARSCRPRPDCRAGSATAFRSAPAQNVPLAPVRTPPTARRRPRTVRKAVDEGRSGGAVDGVAGLRPVDRDRRTPRRRSRSARCRRVSRASVGVVPSADGTALARRRRRRTIGA